MALLLLLQAITDVVLETREEGPGTGENNQT